MSRTDQIRALLSMQALEGKEVVEIAGDIEAMSDDAKHENLLNGVNVLVTHYKQLVEIAVTLAQEVDAKDEALTRVSQQVVTMKERWGSGETLQ